MPVRKSAPAKKTSPAKSAAKPLAKKVAAAKKAPAKKTTPAKKSASSSKQDSLGQRIANAIAAGDFDGDLGLLDDALTQRTNDLATAKKTAAAKTTTAKKVSAPPKKSTSASVTPVKDSTYVVAATLKSLAGAKVKFRHYKAVEGGVDEKKSVVEMLTDKPGSPKGKVVVIPTAALTVSAAPRRSTKK